MNHKDQLKRVNQLVEEIRTCMFTTESNHGGLRSRPMATAACDDDGTIWFFTDDDSAKIDELKNHQPVLLSYARPSDNSYVSITGNAMISHDQQKKEEIFSVISKAWFPEGPESKDLALLKFTPTKAEYWDSSDSSIIQLYRIGKALLTGNTYEAEEEEHAVVDY